MTENSQNTQPIKPETQEQTQPVKIKPETRLHSQADQTPEQIQPEAAVPVQSAPDWLIEFASQKGSSASHISPEEDTREIKVNQVPEPSLLQEDTQPISTVSDVSTAATAWLVKNFHCPQLNRDKAVLLLQKQLSHWEQRLSPARKNNFEKTSPAPWTHSNTRKHSNYLSTILTMLPFVLKLCAFYALV